MASKPRWAPKALVAGNAASPNGMGTGGAAVISASPSTRNASAADAAAALTDPLALNKLSS
ncbi:hypothetical protein GCM10023108_50200 [Saccharopolyspora hordei]